MILDYRGEPWEVMESRPTPHGFDIYLGRRVDGVSGSRRPKLILKKELVEYLTSLRRELGEAAISAAKKLCFGSRHKIVSVSDERAQSRTIVVEYTEFGKSVTAEIYLSRQDPGESEGVDR